MPVASQLIPAASKKRGRFLPRITTLVLTAVTAFGSICSVKEAVSAERERRPNIIFILADDQGYGNVGCYGSKAIQTPNIDRLAEEGLRFTDCYSGSAVCAPTRCVLMTGLHTGHCRRRDNAAKGSSRKFEDRKLVPLAPDDLTIATVLKRAGYVTGGFGKWGLGNPGTTGTPDKHGFDHFFGYLDQVHAHDYYPKFLVRNGEEVELPGNGKQGRKTYSHTVIAEAALDFIRTHRERPFFLYLPYTLPHGKYVVPSDEPYSDRPWSQEVKNYAAMNTLLDRSVGDVMQLLKELDLDEKTIVFYTSDNGPNPDFLADLDSNGPFDGIKRSLREGGIRCPMIVRWPGRVPAGKESDYVWSHKDFFATACELAGIDPPSGLDSVSVLPTLRGERQTPQPHLYWEFYSPIQQAVRLGHWKGIRRGSAAPVALFDLRTDPGESHDVAAENPQVVQQIEAIMAAEHVESPDWPLASARKGKK